MTAAPDPSWWDDWLKFTPGWLAFLVTLGTGVRKALNRRNRLALGPDDAKVRDALTTTRGLFEEITNTGGKTVNWFQDPERRETARHMRDLAARRKDKALREAMGAVAASWDEAFAWAPPDRLFVSWGRERTPQERAEDDADLERSRKQVDEAHRGWQHVDQTRSRLNELELRTHGRT
jgi:hypothetical protein